MATIGKSGSMLSVARFSGAKADAHVGHRGQAHVGLVDAVEANGLVVGHAREWRDDVDADGLPCGGEEAFDDGVNHFGARVAHLEIDLRELGLAVGAQVFVAEAARDLEILVEARDHEDLLELLRRLRQRVELAGMDAAGHQVRRLGRALPGVRALFAGAWPCRRRALSRQGGRLQGQGLARASAIRALQRGDRCGPGRRRPERGPLFPDGELDITKWSRPQHDGPALTALTAMRFWRLNLSTCDEFRGEAGAAYPPRPGIHLAPRRRTLFRHLGRRVRQTLLHLAGSVRGSQERRPLGRGPRRRSARPEPARRPVRTGQEAGSVLVRRPGAFTAAASCPSARPRPRNWIFRSFSASCTRGWTAAPTAWWTRASTPRCADSKKLFASAYAINRDARAGLAYGRYQGDTYFSGGASYFSAHSPPPSFITASTGCRRPPPTVRLWLRATP